MSEARHSEGTYETAVEAHLPSPLKGNDREMFRTRNDMIRRLIAIVQREGDGYVALCPEVDIASQEDTVNEARDNLIEALTPFFEAASGGKSTGACATKST